MTLVTKIIHDWRDMLTSYQDTLVEGAIALVAGLLVGYLILFIIDRSK